MDDTLVNQIMCRGHIEHLSTGFANCSTGWEHVIQTSQLDKQLVAVFNDVLMAQFVLFVLAPWFLSIVAMMLYRFEKRKKFKNSALCSTSE